MAASCWGYTRVGIQRVKNKTISKQSCRNPPGNISTSLILVSVAYVPSKNMTVGDL